jgi:hypothetical protein
VAFKEDDVEGPKENGIGKEYFAITIAGHR